MLVPWQFGFGRKVTSGLEEPLSKAMVTFDTMFSKKSASADSVRQGYQNMSKPWLISLL